jgi:hypothetical protein
MSEDGDSAPRQRRSTSSRYSTFVGIAFLVVIVIATINTIRNRDAGILGTDTADRGTPLAEFAVPKLRGSTEGDANVFQDDCETSANPCPPEDRRTPACDVDLPQIIRVCDLFDRPLVISFWFTGGADCLPTQDVVDRVAKRFQGRVNFLSIDVRDDRDEARRIVEQRGWTIPVGYDADGAVSNLYRVGVCPTVAFAYPGGILSGARIGSDELSEAQLIADTERLLRESRRRAEVER